MKEYEADRYKKETFVSFPNDLFLPSKTRLMSKYGLQMGCTARLCALNVGSLRSCGGTLKREQSDKTEEAGERSGAVNGQGWLGLKQYHQSGAEEREGESDEARGHTVHRSGDSALFPLLVSPLRQTKNQTKKLHI